MTGMGSMRGGHQLGGTKMSGFGNPNFPDPGENQDKAQQALSMIKAGAEGLASKMSTVAPGLFAGKGPNAQNAQGGGHGMDNVGTYRSPAPPPTMGGMGGGMGGAGLQQPSWGP